MRDVTWFWKSVCHPLWRSLFFCKENWSFLRSTIGTRRTCPWVLWDQRMWNTTRCELPPFQILPSCAFFVLTAFFSERAYCLQWWFFLGILKRTQVRELTTIKFSFSHKQSNTAQTDVRIWIFNLLAKKIKSETCCFNHLEKFPGCVTLGGIQTTIRDCSEVMIR